MEIPEIRIALFGAQGSGKTTLLASYFGNLQANSFDKRHGYYLEANDVQTGSNLLGRYFKLKEGAFPTGTDKAAEYSFSLKIRGLSDPVMRIVWFDYPGGWWDRTPKDESEAEQRKQAIHKLTTSHVGLLLVDGSEFKENGVPFVRKLLAHMKGEIRKVKDTIAPGDQDTIPSQWIIGISKADLLKPGTTAETVAMQIVADAQDELQGFADAVGSTTFGNDFLLLSSVLGDGAKVLDAARYKGLPLVAPVALLSVLEALAAKAGTGAWYGGIASFLSWMKSVVPFIDKLDDFLPKKYQALTLLLKIFAVPTALQFGEDKLREKQAAAAKTGKGMEACALAMNAELASPEAKEAFYRVYTQGKGQ